ncbi:Bug family tripartite tricarboxylate transporter substrate binding protein [Cupriavidus consociatus]|uniref:Bug family tripartite tricarboxylate transporter substrate binding protein n=1 Tax=Cupriavidus consociatus TaxID=2821357 RepID=UPI001AE56A84|nr:MULTISPECIES: tripartite tricarboxylate transporter substrate binding protein [unclassified Cupriavidus]MBP0625181.1 tripartite tricarboxylate transporter substrate binding protein [Cupriavidus sp. LEh25]MDK2661921.1 tripartite tricarboxylate transporter substrate binding protein [Cupriavidus sp. LEh21]
MHFAKSLPVALLSFCLAGAVFAQYPDRPIRIVNPYAPGGTADIVSRTIATPLGQALGQPVVVENKGGAGGAVGTAEVARAAADGYTFAISTVGSMVIIPATMPRPGYSPSDFVPIMNIAATPNIIAVHPSFPAKNAKEFLAVLKANPGKYSYASSGLGGINHMLGESFQALSGTELVHVPYRGSGPAVSDVIAGQVPILVDQLASSKTFIDAGKLRLIGVIAPKRLPEYPNVPTFDELGLKGFADQAWYGLIAPAKTPAPVIAKVSAALKQVLARPEVRAQLERAGAIPVGSSPAEYSAQLKSELDAMRKLVQTRKIEMTQ